MLLIGIMNYCMNWLNIKDCNYVTNEGAHNIFNLPISSGLEPIFFHELFYHIMSYLIIDLAT
jgi:hypothetical protein